jgi:hypothetical protein
MNIYIYIYLFIYLFIYSSTNSCMPISTYTSMHVTVHMFVCTCAHMYVGSDRVTSRPCALRGSGNISRMLAKT